MATYLTDSWSSIYGLASVAYGSPERYPEVANQIRSKSVVSFLGDIPPSEVVGNMLKYSDMQSVLQSEYERGGDFADYVDSGFKSISELSEEYYSKILGGFNEFSSYETSLTDVLEYTFDDVPIDVLSVKNTLIQSVPDLALASDMGTLIPYTKLDKLPAGSRIELDDNVQIDTDHKGVGLSTGYLSPSDYFNNVGYPGMTDELPTNIIKSVSEGYIGYPTYQPLDDISRPGFSSLLSAEDIGDVRNVSRSIAGLATLNTLRDLTSMGRMSESDRAMYSFDLAEVIVEQNGYTVFDPNNSNGDLIDPRLLPDYDKKNADSGLPSSARSRSRAF